MKRQFARICMTVLMLTCLFAFCGSITASAQTAVEKLAVKRLEKLGANKKSVKNLKKAFKWSASLKYKDNTTNKKGTKAAKYYGTYGFKMKNGDCNTVAYTFYWMAKALGYDAKAVQGYVPDGSLSNLRSHAWVMIEIKGKTYYFDPDYNRALSGKTVQTRVGKKKLGPYCGFKFTYGTPGTYMYHNEKKKPMEKIN